jgi:thiol-disulfide isomerase/thioredoxin
MERKQTNEASIGRIAVLAAAWMAFFAIAGNTLAARAADADPKDSAKNAAKDSADNSAKDSQSADDAKPPAHEDPLVAELRKTKDKLDEVMPVMSAVADPDFQKEDAAKVRPLLKKSADLLAKLAANEKDEDERAGLERDRCQYLAMLATLGDDDAAAALRKLAAGKGETAIMAKSGIALSQWWRASKDATKQEKILDDYRAVAKANPKSENVTLALAVMATIGPASDDLTIKAAEILRKVMIGDTAKKLAAQLDPNGALRELVGKPLLTTGRTSSGKQFSTADWKGKVVLVDFWATWCGPCNAEIPRMKEIYKSYHPKGLEMVGVDCDGSDDTVNSFTKDKEMPWTQLREESQSESQPWHPLAMRWGVIGIPTMFLIDKKGVLRFVDAREDTSTKIDELLAEQLPTK